VIGYPIFQTDLEALIEEEAPGWLKRAAERTTNFRLMGFYEEGSSIWSEVKPAYMKLQGNSKCAYCERKLESVEYGRGEQDVEHFRPKAKIKRWRVPRSLAKEGIAVSEIPNPAPGYYLLPYHPFNYSASCKPCNSALKKNYFPIASNYNVAGENPAQMMGEEPYLVFPIGDFDENPENLIRFHGVAPQAVANNAHRRARALVTIEFFKLDSLERKNLIRERIAIIIALFPHLATVADNPNPGARLQALQIINLFTSPNASHTNCARSYQRLFQSDRIEAQGVRDRAVALMESIS
jgi:hypothetical protein